MCTYCEDTGGEMTEVQHYWSFPFTPGIGPAWNTFNRNLSKSFGRLKTNPEHSIKKTMELVKNRYKLLQFIKP